MEAQWQTVDIAGPPVAAELRAYGWAEQAVLVEGALDAAEVDRTTLTDDAALLDTLVVAPSGARAGARVMFDDASGRLAGVEVRLAAGDPLDEIVLRSYAVGAVHMALGWVLTESIAVDPDSGEAHDLTIRSFGIIRARDMPPVTITVLDDAGPPRAGRPTRCSPQWRLPRGTQSPARKAPGPIRSPRDTRASRLLRR